MPLADLGLIYHRCSHHTVQTPCKTKAAQFLISILVRFNYVSLQEGSKTWNREAKPSYSNPLQ